MAQIGIIRCEKNENRCPLTGCIKSMNKSVQGFAGDKDNQLIGIFTCRCPGDSVVDMAKILKSKGADTIHLCTCIFSAKEDGKWHLGDGFCDKVDTLAQRISQGAGIPCIKGTAHLPEGYSPEQF